MEYADGGSLKKYLKENFKNLTWEDKYKLAFQLANAVSCLHDEKIVHRDLVILYNYYFIKIIIDHLYHYSFNFVSSFFLL